MFIATVPPVLCIEAKAGDACNVSNALESGPFMQYARKWRVL